MAFYFRMSHWIKTDKASFFNHILGQIHPRTSEGVFIQDLLGQHAGASIKNVVEIGTWNGLGSTLCILNGLFLHQDIPFYSLECCKEKQLTAVENLENNITNSTHLLWGTVVDVDRIQSEDYLKYFTSINKEWYEVDLKNCLETPNVLSALPAEIDFLLLDGGEYTSLNEFEILFPRCTQYILLDDTYISKCQEVENRLQSNTSWKRIFHSEERNGFSCWQKMTA
jgi:hypothetical protein